MTDGQATFQPASALADGTYNIQARVSDVAGNEGTSSVAEMVIDATAPTVTLSAPAITTNTQPTVTITVTDSGSGVADGTAVYVDVDLNGDGDFADDGEAAYATLSLADGQATFQPSEALADGTYHIQARVSDAAGNEGGSDVATTIVDTTDPIVTVSVAAATNSSQPTATITVSDAGSGVANGTTVYIDVDLDGDGAFTSEGETGYATVTVTDGTASFQPAAALADGTYHIQARVSDAAGNEGTSSVATTVIDTVAPTITLSIPSVTNNDQPTGTITVADSGSGVADGTAVYVDVDLNGDGDYADDGETGYATLSLASGQASFQPSSALADGTYHVRVRVSDAAGNQGTSAVSTVVVDTVAPTVTINQASNQTDPSSGSVIYFTVVFSEEVTDFTSADVTLGGTALPTSVSVSGSGTTYTLAVSGMKGTGTVTATIAAGVATDAAGNTSAASTSTDNQVQYTSTTQSFTLTGPTDNEYSSGDNMSIEWTASIAATGSKISLCLDEDTTWDNGNEHWIEIDQVTAANGSGSYAWNTALIEPGTYYVAGYLWNGNNTFTLSHLTESITITGEDWTPQTFTLTGPTSGSYTSGDMATINWTAGGVIAGSKISLCLDKDTTWGNGNDHWIMIDQVTAANGSGSLQWNTAAIEPGTYYVAGYLWDGGTTFTTSHLTTSITITGANWTAQAFTLTGPASGSYTSGDTATIQWTAAGVVSGSKISLCMDEDTTLGNGNEHWIKIDQVAAANGSGSLVWNTAAVKPGTYYVAGYLWDGGNTFTTSHLTTSITITGTWAAQSFALTAPTSGSYTAGDSVSIDWTAGGVVNGSLISLCYDQDTTLGNGNEHWIEIDQQSAANGSGSYTWDTTGVSAGTYYVAGYMWDGGTTFTFSHLSTSITITAAESLTVASDLAKPSETSVLSTEQLSAIVTEAKVRLTAALGTQVSNALDQISFQVANLRDGLLGQTSGSTIKIDDNSAGYGWFIDSTPADDSEFVTSADSNSLVATSGSAADGRADLLTTVMHEMGHVLGYSDESLGDLMDGTLPLGVRRTEVLDQVFATL